MRVENSSKKEKRGRSTSAFFHLLKEAPPIRVYVYLSTSVFDNIHHPIGPRGAGNGVGGIELLTILLCGHTNRDKSETFTQAQEIEMFTM